MQRNSSFWFGWPKEEISATERARQAARRQSRLEQHMLQDRKEPSPSTGTTQPAFRADLRDPSEFVGGVDVQELPDSAYGRLFASEDNPLR